MKLQSDFIWTESMSKLLYVLQSIEKSKLLSLKFSWKVIMFRSNLTCNVDNTSFQSVSQSQITVKVINLKCYLTFLHVMSKLLSFILKSYSLCVKDQSPWFQLKATVFRFSWNPTGQGHHNRGPFVSESIVTLINFRTSSLQPNLKTGWKLHLY